jgi:hypothetical protein
MEPIGPRFAQPKRRNEDEFEDEDDYDIKTYEQSLGLRKKEINSPPDPARTVTVFQGSGMR